MASSEVEYAAHSWNHPRSNVLFQLIQLLSQEEPRHSVTARLRCVNRHWRDAIREQQTEIRTHPRYPFRFETFSRFPNLETLVLHNPTWSEAEFPSFWLPSRLEHLEISSVETFEPFRELACRIPHLKSLSVETEHFHEDALLGKALCFLDLTSFRLDATHVDVSHRFLRFLSRHSNLQRLELPSLGDGFVGEIETLFPLFQLKSLRLHVRSFNPSALEHLSCLSGLRSLVLDGSIYETEVEWLSLPELRHLSLSSCRIPPWLAFLPNLCSLKLETWDTFWVKEHATIVHELAQRLNALHLMLHEAPRDVLSFLLSGCHRLEKLTVEGEFPNTGDLDSVRNVRELQVIQSRGRVPDANRIGEILAFPDLEALTVESSIVIPGALFFEEAWLQPSKLKALVLHRVCQRAQRAIGLRLPELYDLRIHDSELANWRWTAQPQTYFPKLRNFCLVNCDYVDRHRCEAFLRMPFVHRLEHLAVDEYFLTDPTFSPSLKEFLESASHVRVDTDAEWRLDL